MFRDRQSVFLLKTYILLTRVENFQCYSSLQKNTQAACVQRNGAQFRNIFLKNIFHFLFPVNTNEYSLQFARSFLVLQSRAILNVTSVHAGMRPQSPLRHVETTCLLLQKAVSCYKSDLSLIFEMVMGIFVCYLLFQQVLSICIRRDSPFLTIMDGFVIVEARVVFLSVA